MGSPTIKDVAREAGVSIATVSYVLNNKNAAISSDTRRHVLEIAARIGYRPNVTARNLRSSQTRLIGFACSADTEAFTYAMARAAEQVDYHLLTFTGSMDDLLTAYDELIRTGRVDAFVLSNPTLDDARISFLLERKFPFVCFGRANPEWDFLWTDTDTQAGFREAVAYLLRLGHRRIALVADISLHGEFCVAGYTEALAQAGIPVREGYIVRGAKSARAGREALARWLTLPAGEQPTAALAVRDILVAGVMNEAHERGLVIGKTFSLIGYDDMPMCEYLHPELTTLQLPLMEISEALMRMLEMVLSKQEPEERHVLISPKLVIRESCAPPI